jgi:DNA excision repair protein ERCC-2
MSEVLSVSVRALCEFAAKRGHLDHRFTPAPSASEGHFAHRWVQARRPGHYLSELPLSAEFSGIQVRGRADGYDPNLNRLEEIKTRVTHAVPVPAEQTTLHWAQAKVYAAMVALARDLENVEVALIYVDLGEFKERIVCQRHSREALLQFAIELANFYQDWYGQQLAHRLRRDRLLAQLPFAFASYRKGQHELAQAVYRNAIGRLDASCQLLVQAPTGIGKTLATLYGQLRAMPELKTDKIFYLTARTTGRALALEAVERLDPARTIRVIELIAKEKSCLHLDKQCHPESCPLANGFYDRLPAARQLAIQPGAMQGHEALATVAKAHDICPYYFNHEMAKWSDVVVADYQYFFDSSALLAAMTIWFDWRVAVLVDEAHSLTDRVREMYSGQLSLAKTAQAARQAPRGTGATFKRLLMAWRQWAKTTPEYSVLDAFPEPVSSAIAETVGRLLPQSEPQADHSKITLGLPVVLPPALLEWLFDALQFERMREQANQDWLIDVQGSQALHSTAIRCVLPRKPIAAQLALANSVVLFSATLAPFEAYKQMHGLAVGCQWLDLPSPFAPEQLEVRLARQVSTRYKDRQGSLTALVSIMREQFEQLPGNYLAFFSSYTYMQQAVQAFTQMAAHIPVWTQASGMSEPERNSYLARFEADGQGIGFAVLGGAFSEGIDLPGSRLVGAFVATLGLPQINPITQAFMQVIDSQLGQGYEQVYLYPGLRKAVQAAGRVIRSEQDRGVLWLLDQRYGQPQIRQLLPDWWQID